MLRKKKRIKNCFEFTTGWCDFSLRRGRITFLCFGEDVVEMDKDVLGEKLISVRLIVGPHEW